MIQILFPVVLYEDKKTLQKKGLKTPDARFELATNGLTVHCSTAELIRNKK